MKNIVVLDLETQRSFDDVGGREAEHLAQLGVSVAGIYSYPEGRFVAFEEREMPELAKRLQEAELVVGFNIHAFDFPVLQPYLGFELARIPTIDIFLDAERELGFWVGLGRLAEATLGQRKSGSGLEALRLFKEGRIEEVKSYCLQDVKLTRDLYEFGLRERHLTISGYPKGQAFPVYWGVSQEERREVTQRIQQALEERKTVEIDYISRTSRAGERFRKQRAVDVYRLSNAVRDAQEQNSGVFEGYCHLRKGNRTFLVRRVIAVRPTERTYVIPVEYQQSSLIR